MREITLPLGSKSGCNLRNHRRLRDRAFRESSDSRNPTNRARARLTKTPSSYIAGWEKLTRGPSRKIMRGRSMNTSRASPPPTPRILSILLRALPYRIDKQ
ncbi:hypothetical protein OBBRIDRAFT_296391 [Obba rivulosa]|uniref:Uncharacterized protein n=1 Tax=Obba rivulosa TaxID=1052685 RepID=A0A8E2AJE0_9APHY|nr:hypothetical protein OBBRIDRAFT_296391 [Obba rivulosa]